MRPVDLEGIGSRRVREKPRWTRSEGRHGLRCGRAARPRRPPARSGRPCGTRSNDATPHNPEGDRAEGGMCSSKQPPAPAEPSTGEKAVACRTTLTLLSNSDQSRESSHMKCNRKFRTGSLEKVTASVRASRFHSVTFIRRLGDGQAIPYDVSVDDGTTGAHPAAPAVAWPLT